MPGHVTQEHVRTNLVATYRNQTISFRTAPTGEMAIFHQLVIGLG